MDLSLQKNNYKFLVLLLSADILFFVLHIGHLLVTSETTLMGQNSSPFVLGKDLGLAESYQYVKEYWIILILAMMAWQRKKFVFAAWSMLFLFFLFDDMLQLHERAGHILVGYFDFVPAIGIRAQDFGELTFTGVVASVFLLIIAVAYWRSDRESRQLSHHFIVLIIALVIFGVVFDMVQILFIDNHFWFDVFGFIEDGGEMLVMSVFCWYVYFLSNQETNKSPFNVL